MRPLYVPVRLAATAVAVVAAAGCMSVGDDASGGGATPSHSAGERGGAAPDGASAVGGNAGYGAAAADEGRGRGKGKKGGGKGKGGDDEVRGDREDGAGPDASPSVGPPAGATRTPP
ncbi:hypothetical protein EF919_19275, partial [Streptomyces sp. WAC02707]